MAGIGSEPIVHVRNGILGEGPGLACRCLTCAQPSTAAYKTVFEVSNEHPQLHVPDWKVPGARARISYEPAPGAVRLGQAGQVTIIEHCIARPRL